MVNAH